MDATHTTPNNNNSKSALLLRALHIEGLPLTTTAARLSEAMGRYGAVQYAEVRCDQSMLVGGAGDERRGAGRICAASSRQSPLAIDRSIVEGLFLNSPSQLSV